MATQFGIAAPQIYARFPIAVEEVKRYAERAERLGYHSLWVQERALLSSAAGALEGVALLGYLAALTRDIRLGNAVFLINLRNPIQLAKSVATLDQLSRGRVIFGVGLGAVTRLYAAYGLSPERRVARFVEGLELIRRLWTEDGLDFEGRFWQVKNASLRPKPFQKPHPPIWFGGHAPAALRRAARYGDGFIGAGSSSIEDFKSEVETVRRALEAEGKDPGRFMIAKRIYIGVHRDRARAAERTREWFKLYYNDAELADRVAVFGTPGECLARLREAIAAGARLLVLNPMFDMSEHMELFASELIPSLREEHLP
jgi:probable F420-dependent oxidoreductase